MKNYLFAPFKNDDEKISSFICLKNMIVNDDACGDYLANELVMFMGRLESYYDCIMTHLKSEKKALNVRCEELKAEISQLKADIKHDAKVCENYDDGLLAEIKELKAEIKRYEKQYRMMASSKEYQKEAEEYFNNNPQSKGVRFHMLDFDDYEYNDGEGMNGLSGEYNRTLYAEDCVVEVDNG